MGTTTKRVEVSNAELYRTYLLGSCQSLRCRLSNVRIAFLPTSQRKIFIFSGHFVFHIWNNVILDLTLPSLRNPYINFTENFLDLFHLQFRRSSLLLICMCSMVFYIPNHPSFTSFPNLHRPLLQKLTIVSFFLRHVP